MEIETQFERHKLHVNFQHTFSSLSVRSLVLSNAVAPPFDTLSIHCSLIAVCRHSNNHCRMSVHSHTFSHDPA